VLKIGLGGILIVSAAAVLCQKKKTATP